MQEDGCIPPLVTSFDSPGQEDMTQSYKDMIHAILSKRFGLYFKRIENPENGSTKIEFPVPLLNYSELLSPPFNLSFFLVAKLRQNAFKFFYEMISRWLVPGKRLNVLLFTAFDFAMPDVSQDMYTLCELRVRIEDLAELEEVRRNLPAIETEIKLGSNSGYYARRILEIKGLASDEKTAIIQAYIAYLIKRLPSILDNDVFSEMQHLMVICNDEFKNARESRHLSRIIVAHYLYRKELRQVVKNNPDRRQLYFKIFKAKLHSPNGGQNVVGIIVGMNFLKDKEVFDDRHLMKAIQNYLPEAQPVEGSYYTNNQGNDDICMIYLEIEKRDGTPFSSAEISRMKRELPSELKERIEHLMHPIFMPRNDEEIMRNILSLGNQLKYLKDIPQVFITFDEQTHTHLYFTIILVRVVSKGDKSIQEYFKSIDTFLEYIHDSCKMVGLLRKKYPKEATVFRVKLPKEMFLRNDHSIDLYKARQIVVSELERIVGNVRDFNGGMISKQNEQLATLRTLLSEGGIHNDFLLENFFYSLAPAVMRSVHDPLVLKNLFLMMIESLETGLLPGEQYTLRIQRELETVYTMICAYDPSVKDVINQALAKLNIPSQEMGTVFVNAYDTSCVGFIYYSNDPYKQEYFCQTLQQALELETHEPLTLDIHG